MKEWGQKRVLEPIGSLPQSAFRLDVTLPIETNEMLIEVEYLNIDSNSYRQIQEICKGDLLDMKKMMLQIISDRGKMHNPVTGSGGMLIGKIIEKGSDNISEFHTGERIATLTSLTLTPLKIHEIIDLGLDNPQVKVRGYAILSNNLPVIKFPKDISEMVALAALDVCGAPKLTELFSNKSVSLLILGGGKSGILSAFAALDSGCTEIAIFEKSLKRIRLLQESNLPFKIKCYDAKNFIELEPHVYDLAIDCMNIPNVEMAAILSTKKNGTIIYFNTATQFTQAALGAEGIGSSVKMLIGNGFYKGHADYTLQLVRRYPVLQMLLDA